MGLHRNNLVLMCGQHIIAQHLEVVYLLKKRRNDGGTDYLFLFNEVENFLSTIARNNVVLNVIDLWRVLDWWMIGIVDGVYKILWFT